MKKLSDWMSLSMKFNIKQSGGSKVFFLLLSPFIAIALTLLGYEINKAYWDMKVRAMCEVDGGATIFERVELPDGEYEKIINDRGWIRIPYEDELKPSENFYRSSSSSYIRYGSPDVYRSRQSIVRAGDGHALSSKIVYSRRGGDFPLTIGHPSSFSCGNDAEDIKRYESVISRRQKG